MRKFFAWSFLVTFAWLQSYQLCDASQDTLESVQAQNAVLQNAQGSLQAPVAPDNDPDVLLASVYDGTLQPHAIVFVMPAMPPAAGLPSIRIAAPPHLIRSALNGPSPPGPTFLLVTSIQSLAPPAA